MLNKEEVLSRKLSLRYCRREQCDLPDIRAIVEECSAALRVKAPELICCESLARSFSAFHLMGEPYIIYDACLIEALYIYDLILASGAKQQDMDKFFYKLFGEECVRNRDLVHALYFARKYRSTQYSFDLDEGAYSHVKSQIAYQSYFLIGHELGHLKIKEQNSEGIPAEYKQFIRAAIGVTTRKRIKEKNLSISEYALTYRDFFPVNSLPQTLYEYLDMLMENGKFLAFMEECYCDFIGYQLLKEKYGGTDFFINTISKALNYLLTQEAIRSDLHDGVEQVKNVHRDISVTLFYSGQRVIMLLLSLGLNHNGEMEKAYADTHDRDQLTDRLASFIKELPDEDVMHNALESAIINFDSKRLQQVLIEKFYYCSVSP